MTNAAAGEPSPAAPELTDIRPADLRHVAELLDGDRHHLADAQTHGFDPLFWHDPRFAGGGDGLAEGRHFQQAYVAATGAMATLLHDLQHRLATLGETVAMVSAHYRQADAATAATLDAVRTAFPDLTPPIYRSPGEHPPAGAGAGP